MFRATVSIEPTMLTYRVLAVGRRSEPLRRGADLYSTEKLEPGQRPCVDATVEPARIPERGLIGKHQESMTRSFLNPVEVLVAIRAAGEGF